MAENVAIAFGCLGAMFVLIYLGMHVAIVLGGVSLVGVWLIRGDFAIASLAAGRRHLLWSFGSHVVGVRHHGLS